MVDSRKSFSNKSNETTTVSIENNSKPKKKNCEDCKANEEYIKVLKNALKEVLDQNEALRARVAELEALISQSEDELEEKNQLIQQLKNTLAELEEQDKQKKNLIQELEKTGGFDN